MSQEKVDKTEYLTKTGPVQKMSGGTFIAKTLKGYGVTHVFFMEAILRRVLFELKPIGITHVLAHSEKSAAYMADGYARASRKPGICMSQSVGAANLAAGLQDAYLGRSPVISITGRQVPMAQYRNTYQEIIHGPLFEPVTKYNVNVDDVKQLPHFLRQAFREATTGRPGPVHLDTMDNVGRVTEAAEAEMEVFVEEPFTRYPAFRPEPEKAWVQGAARVLEEAERPVIVAGGGATASSAGPDIVELAEMLSIPVATSLNGKGTILENHPLSVGIVGTYSCWCANKVVSEADLVLFIGSCTGDQVTNVWTVPKPGTPVIQIDIEPSEIGRSYPVTVGLMGDAKVTVRRLIEVVDTKTKKTKWSEHARSIVNEWLEEIRPLQESDNSPIRVERLCKELTECLPSNAVLVACTGWSGLWTGTMVHMTHPGQSYIRAAGSLGWGFPASLGAKCGVSDRPVVCFTGDGGLWYHIAELETASRNGIKTVTVVNNNHALNQDAHGLKRVFGDRPENDGLVRFQETNFANIAREMGCMGIRVEKAGEIAGALKRALETAQPALVEVVTDPSCAAPSPWTPE